MAFPVRLAWAAAMLLVAICAAGLQLDRASRLETSLAAIVPAPFRAFAFETIVADDLKAGRAQDAFADAGVLVKRRPIPAFGLALLGLSADALNQHRLASLAIEQSGTRGWREPLTQAILAQGAIRSGHWDNAVLRVLALRRTGYLSDSADALLQALAAQPQGLEALIRRMTVDPGRIATLFWASDYLPAKDIGQMVSRMRGANVPLECGALSGIVQNLVADGAASEARQVWTSPCAGSGDAASIPSFSADDRPNPFAWRSSDTARIVSGTGNSGIAVEYDNDVPGLTAIATAYATLPPGSYVTRVTAQRDGGDSALPITLMIACIDSQGNQTLLSPVNLGDGRGNFVIPQQGCAAQFVKLAAPHGSGNVSGLAISRDARAPAAN